MVFGNPTSEIFDSLSTVTIKNYLKYFARAKVSASPKVTLSVFLFNFSENFVFFFFVVQLFFFEK